VFGSNWFGVLVGGFVMQVLGWGVGLGGGVFAVGEVR